MQLYPSWQPCLGLTTDPRFTFLTSDHDKIAHAFVFGLESWLFVKSIGYRYVQFPRNIAVDKFVLALLVCTVGAGIGSEFAQSVLSNGRRKFDVLDIACNVCGSLVGILAAYCVEPPRR